jgi:hypothetical protein
VALTSHESKVFAKGKTDGFSHQLFISIISSMLRFQVLKKFPLPWNSSHYKERNRNWKPREDIEQ